jgi:hypothetical protein
MKQTIKTGTRIEFFQGHGRSEMASIGRWTKVNGPVKNHVAPNNGGWHLVRFDDGGALIVHETGFRVIDNRA